MTNNWKPSKASRQEPLSSFEIVQARKAGERVFRSLAAEDSIIMMLWGVDWQVDFIWGTLPVPNGDVALANFLEYAYDNVHKISRITASADDHLINQIFFPSMWIDQNGQHPDATYPVVITAQDIMDGRWTPIYDPEWQMRYVFRLEQHRKNMVIWQYHCLRGTHGASLAPAWMEYLAFWTGARNAQYNHTVKGSFWGSEMYAPQQALVPHPADPNSKLVRLYTELEEVDEIVAGGLAENFCFDEWMNANIDEFSGRAPEILRKFRLDRSFTAPITAIPGWEDGLRQQYSRYMQHGIVVDNLGNL